ncbi:Filamentous hemagglutinin [Gluconacetobacter sp. SXCC-1]|nr:Filamentous hemagglutinin [Gluconacetobacter sp. SXCC-1]
MMKTPRRTAAPDIIPGPSRLQRCVHVFAAVSLFLASTVSAASAQQAEPQIVVDPHAGGPEPTLDKTQNGIDQVNIATPNAAGVSHNDFIQYGVPESGVILNNATTATETKIGGVVYGNTNLDGHAASLILNEVTGTLPTQMLGYTEVAGHQASVVVANPNGITCAGCGFINTAHVTLATGTPEMDASGNLKDIVVRGGNITFEGKGGDFTTVPVLDILSRSVTLKAQVNAKTATIVAGRNRVDYGTNAAHPLASDGTAAPEFAIDTAALGGMYANRIYMVVNEAGAGVRVDGTMAANAGDMTLTDAGDLVLNGSMAASGNLQAQVGGQVSNAGTLQSGGGMQLAAGGALNNSGTIGGGTTLAARAAAIGNSGTVTAGAGALSLSATGALDNSGGIGASGGALSARAGSLANTGTIAAQAELTLASGSTLSNAGGQISSTTGLASIAAVGALDNTGGKILDQSGDMTLSAQAVTNNGGAIQAGGSLTAALASYTSDTTASLTAQQALAVTATGAVDNEGTLGGGTGVSVTADHIANGASALLVATAGNLTLNAAGTGGLANTGIIKSQSASGSLTIDAATLANSDSILAAGTLGVRTAGTVTSTGTLYGAAGLSLAAGGALSNRGGQLGSDTGVVQLAAASLDNTGGKIIATDGGLNIDAASVANNNGWLQAAALMSIVTTALGNTGGVIRSGSDIVVDGVSNESALGSVNNTEGKIEATDDINISGGNIDNTGGTLLAASGNASIDTEGTLSNSFVNDNGILQAATNVSLKTEAYSSTANSVVTAGNLLSINVTGDTDNEGELIGGSGIEIATGVLTNKSTGTIAATSGNLALTTTGSPAAIPAFSNDGTIETLSTTGNLDVTTASLSNTGSILSQYNQNLTAVNTTSNSGEIAAIDGTLAFNTGSLNNQGTFAAGITVSGIVTGALINSGTMYGAIGLNLHAGTSIGNAGGAIGSSSGNVMLTATGITNSNGKISTKTGNISTESDQLTNNSGAILADSGAIQISGAATKSASSDIFNTQGGIIQAGNGLSIVSRVIINDDGTLVTTSGDIDVTSGVNQLAATVDNRNGGIIQSASSLTIDAMAVDNTAGQMLSLGGNLALNTSTLSNAAGVIKTADALNISTGTYTSDSTSVVQAGGIVSLAAIGSIDNEGSLIGGTGIHLSGDSLVNGSAALLGTATGNLIVAALGNSGLTNSGRIENADVSGRSEITAAVLRNTNTILTQGNQVIDVTGALSNSGEVASLEGSVAASAGSTVNNGLLAAATGMTITAADGLSNTGTIYGGSGAVISAGALVSNLGGQIGGGQGSLAVDATEIANEGGVLQAGNNVQIMTAALDNSNEGAILAGQSVFINNDPEMTALQTLDNAGGLIQASDNLTISAADLANGGGTIVSTAGSVGIADGAPGLQLTNLSNTQGGVIQAASNLTISASDIDNTNGSLLSTGGNIALSEGVGATLTNKGGAIKADDNLTVTEGEYTTDAASVMSAGGALDLSVSDSVDNEGALIGETGADITAVGLTNGAYALIAAGSGQLALNLTGNIGLNNAGMIETVGTEAGLNITAQALSNSGTIVAQGDQSLQVLSDVTNDGRIGALGGSIALAATSLINASDAEIVAAESLSIAVGNGGISNAGLLYGTTGATFDDGAEFLNRNGQIGAGIAPIILTASSLDNTAGVVIGAGSVSIQSNSVTNANGAIQAAGALALQTDAVNNDGGALLSTKSGIKINNGTSGPLDHVLNEGGAIQAASDVTVTATTLDNGKGGLVFAKNGAITVDGGNGVPLASLSNSGGRIQAGNDIVLSTSSLDNSSGSVMTQAGDLTITNAGNALTSLADMDGTLQSAGNLTITTDVLDGGGQLTAGASLNLSMPDGWDSNAVLVSGGTMNLNFGQGGYTVEEGSGALAGGDLTIDAGSLTNNGALTSGGSLVVTSGDVIANTGLIDGARRVSLTLPGALTNIQGAILSDAGSIAIRGPGNGYAGAVVNQSGEIEAGSAAGDISIQAASLTNDVTGGVTVENNVAVYREVYATAVTPPSASQIQGGMPSDWGQYYYGQKVVEVQVPAGLTTSTGQPGSGYFIAALYDGNASSNVTVTGTGSIATLNGAASLIDAGRDLTINTTGDITNDASHIAAGGNITMSGNSLNNIGYTNQITYEFQCQTENSCRYFRPVTDAPNVPTKLGWDIGPRYFAPRIWGTVTDGGATATIMAAGDVNGQFVQTVSNDSWSANALPDISYTGTTTEGVAAASAAALTAGYTSKADINPDFGTTVTGLNTRVADAASVSDSAIRPDIAGSAEAISQPSSVKGQASTATAASTPAYDGVIAPATVETNAQALASLSLPGFSASSDPTIATIVASVPGGQALFVPDPLPDAHYLIETNPRYATLSGFYGSQYLLNRLGDDTADYYFLGDATFDTDYVQQQIVAATGQTFLGGSYLLASDEMKILLDNAATEDNALGLTLGDALTSQQQAALTQDIVWYVTEEVDGKSVLVPKLYLAAGTATLTDDGAVIGGRNVSLTAGSVTNSGTIAAQNALTLTATDGDIINSGGTLSGGTVALNAMKGSIVNQDTLQTFLIGGGSASELTGQANIVSGGTTLLDAADNITFKGGTLTSGGNLALLAGQGIDIGALTATAQGSTHATHLSLSGHQAENYGVTISSGGDATLGALGGDLTFSGSTLSAAGSASMMAAGNLDLSAVTNESSYAASGSKSGFLSSSSFSDTQNSSTQVGSAVIANDNIAMASGKNMSIQGVVAAGGNAEISSGGEFALNSMTDMGSSSSTSSEGHFLNSENSSQSVHYSDEIGSTITAGNALSIGSAGDMSLKGEIAAQGDVTLAAGGAVTENAVKETVAASSVEKSSGLFLGTSGASARIGFGKTTDTDTYSQTSWTPSEIASTGGNLSITANGPVTINGSDLGAAKDATVTGSSVSFNALEDVATQTQTHKSLFIGDTTGLNPNSVVGQMVDSALSASQVSGKDSGKLAALDGAQAAMTGVSTGVMATMKGGITQVKSLSSLFEEGKTPKGNIDLIAVQSNIGFDLEKSSTTLTTGTVQGSTAAAGNTLAVTATGGVPTDSQSGNIVATASQLSGQDVTLTAPGQVTLQAGYDTTHEVASSKSIEASVGASASIGTKGAGVSIEGEFGASKTNTNAASSTAVDSTVSGTDNVTIANATGTTTLNGAEISGKSIDVATKDLTITTAQDTSGYNSKTTGIDASFSVPVWGAGDIGGSASFSHTTVKDSYASTEATQSGLYAGSGGLDVTASGTTTLNGGVIESTAAAALNQLSTGTLVANDIANHADATAKTMGYQANVMNPEGATGGGTGSFATAIGTGMAANAGGLLGAATRKDASSVTQSAIGSNVQIAAGSTSGDLSRSPSTSSHPLTNTFDAQQMQNDLQIQQVGSQVVGQVGGMVSDALHSKGVAGFDETNWKDNYGRILMEAAGNAGVAALGNGNVAAAGIGTASAGLATSAILPSAAAWAVRQSGNLDTEIALTNIITNAVASAAGAAGGLTAGGSTSIDALTGAAAASAIQQNNMSQQMAVAVEIAEIASKVLESAPNPIAKGVGIVIDAGTAVYVAHDALANHLPDGKGTTVHSEIEGTSGSPVKMENEKGGISETDGSAAPEPGGEEPDEGTDRKNEDGIRNNAANNIIGKEKLKDDLASSQEKPKTYDSELSNLMNDLYRPHARVGSGSTADAVRAERITGEGVGGKFHSEKAENYVRALESWLNTHPNALTTDKMAAQNVLRDLKNSLEGK